MSGVSYAVYGFSSSRATPDVTLYRCNTGGNALLQLLRDNLKIDILAIGQKYPSFYRPCFFNIDRVINFETFLGKQFLVDDTGLQKIRLTLLYLSLLVYFQLCIYL